MRIMTSNIWGDYFKNPVSLREQDLFSVYRKYAPDVIGFQEVTPAWHDSKLFLNLRKDYNIIGTDMCDRKSFTPMAIKKEFAIIAYGHEQLENTPDFSKSITWAVLERAGVRFAVCNTHFWWMRGNEAEWIKKDFGVENYTLHDHNMLRCENARQLSAIMKQLNGRYDVSVFALGDMNGTATEEMFDVYAQNGIISLYNVAEQRDNICSIHGDPVQGDDGRYHGKKTTPEYIAELRSTLSLPQTEEADAHLCSIDHIVALGDGFKVVSYCVVEDQKALDATDHSPVFADVDLT